MSVNRRLLALFVSVGLASIASGASNELLPPGKSLSKDLKLPSNAIIAVYLPAAKREFRLSTSVGGLWGMSGHSFEANIKGVLQGYFAPGFVIDAGADTPFGLLLAIHPELKAESGKFRTTLSYRVIDPAGKVLLTDQQVDLAPMRQLNINDLSKSWQRAARLVMYDVLTRLQPDAGKYPAVGLLKNLKPIQYVDHDKDTASGTGFYINAAGQVLTAAHVLDDCALVEVQRDEQILAATPVAQSHLVDLAVLDTATPAPHFLPLRKGYEITLGEAVTNVGFPLQKILAATPNLTRGNVSSRGALAGSVGQFQFSAPIQPGSSGGPVVSDGGELLGITVSTLATNKFIPAGALPQNVNFALDARYAAMFLQRNNIAFTEVEPNAQGNIHIANDAALGSVVGISCFQ